MSLFVGEGNEEIGNMIHNYIKEIEELRYSLYFIGIFCCFLISSHSEPFSANTLKAVIQ